MAGFMTSATYTFSAALWLWDFEGGTAWVFVTLPEEASTAIEIAPRPPKPGFGSVRVDVALGGSRWSTSIFPDSRVGRFILPIKKAVRKAEGVDAGDTVDVTVTMLE
jgi:hypothetical protein